MIRQTIAAAIVVALFGAGCSFRPVYSDGSPMNAMSLAFDLDEPTSRLEQIAYQEIALRFSTSTAPRTPTLTISVSTSHRDGLMSRNPVVSVNGAVLGERDEAEVTVSVLAVARLDGREIFRATRQATAPYMRAFGSSVLMDQSIVTAAEETATKAATESLRLALLGAFPRNGSYLTPKAP